MNQTPSWCLSGDLGSLAIDHGDLELPGAEWDLRGALYPGDVSSKSSSRAPNAHVDPHLLPNPFECYVTTYILALGSATIGTPPGFGVLRMRR